MNKWFAALLAFFLVACSHEGARLEEDGGGDAHDDLASDEQDDLGAADLARHDQKPATRDLASVGESDDLGAVVDVDLADPSAADLAGDLATTAIAFDFAGLPATGCGAGTLDSVVALADGNSTGELELHVAQVYGADVILAGGDISAQVRFNAGTPQETTIVAGGYGGGFFGRFTAAGELLSGRRIGGYYGGVVRGVAPLADGGTIVFGNIGGDATIDGVTWTPIENQYDTDVYLARFDAANQLVWIRQLGGDDLDWPWAMAVSPNGRILTAYRAGGLEQETRINVGRPDEVTIALPATNWEEIMLAEHDLDGHVIWTGYVGGASRDDRATGLAWLPDGGFAIAGEFERSLAFSGSSTSFAGGANNVPNLFVARYAANHSLVWARAPIGSSRAAGVGLLGDRLYVTGSAAGDLVFGAGEANEATLGAGGMFVATFDVDSGALGSLVRTSTFVEEATQTVLPSGAVLTGGRHNYDATFTTKSGDVSHNAQYNWEDAYLTCGSIDQPLDWVRFAGGNQHDEMLQILQLSDGTIVALGSYTADIDFPGKPTLSTNGLWTNTFLARYTPL